MERRATVKPLPGLAALILVGALFLSACTQVSQGSTTAPRPGNAVVRIIADEWSFKPSLTSVPAGKVSFEVVNQGKVDHEMVLLRTDRKAKDMVMAGTTGKIDETGSGENVGEIEVEAGVTEAGTFNLAPGHYVMVCNIPAHYMQGMSSDLEVTGTAPESAPKAEAPKTAPQASTASTVPGVRKEITVLQSIRPTLENTLAAAQKGDMVAASKALHQYDILWHGVEVYLNFRSPKLYGELETDIQARLTKLLDNPQSSQADIVSTAKEMLAKWDESLQLMTSSPALSPLFDDLEAIRMLKAETINEIDPLLKAGDVDDAKAIFAQFMGRWPEVEDLIKSYSVDAYADTESAMAKANTAFQKSKPVAAELRPLVADTLANYNFGQALINAAARNSDLTKTTFTPEIVKSAASVGAIQTALNASLASWKAAKYQEAGDNARRASGELFSNVSGALKTRNNADVALQKALDAYTALSDKAGDATAVAAAQKAAVQAAAVAQQVLVGQFWTDAKFKDAFRAASSLR